MIEQLTWGEYLELQRYSIGDDGAQVLSPMPQGDELKESLAALRERKEAERGEGGS